MRLSLGGLFGVFLLSFPAVSFAALTIHLQSPWRDDAEKSAYDLHILGGTTGYNPSYDSASVTRMTPEGDGWSSYTWEKSISDFTDWQNFNVKACPDSSDQNYNNNNCVAWTDASGTAHAFTMAALFGTETEVWIYTESSGDYTKSFIPPGSKIVWFKSPWGNKALPQMIYGADSVLMRFAQDDPATCGWFYGAISPTVYANNPLGEVSFQRFRTSWMKLPSDGSVIELTDALASNDTIFIDGTVSPLESSKEIGTLGECFDSSRTIHVYHPWRANTSYRDSAFYISIQNNVLNSLTALDSVSRPS